MLSLEVCNRLRLAITKLDVALRNDYKYEAREAHKELDSLLGEMLDEREKSREDVRDVRTE